MNISIWTTRYDNVFSAKMGNNGPGIQTSLMKYLKLRNFSHTRERPPLCYIYRGVLGIEFDNSK